MPRAALALYCRALVFLSFSSVGSGGSALPSKWGNYAIPGRRIIDVDHFRANMSEAAILILDGLAGLEVEDESGELPSPEVRLALGSIFGER